MSSVGRLSDESSSQNAQPGSTQSDSVSAGESPHSRVQTEPTQSDPASGGESPCSRNLRRMFSALKVESRFIDLEDSPAAEPVNGNIDDSVAMTPTPKPSVSARASNQDDFTTPSPHKRLTTPPRLMRGKKRGKAGFLKINKRLIWHNVKTECPVCSFVLAFSIASY